MSKPLRVLQVVCNTDRGGAETWLLHVLRHIDRREVAMDFLVHNNKPGAYDAEIASEGAGIFICSGHRNLLRQLYGLRRLQRLHGPYQIVHSHVDYYGGIICLLTRLLGVRGRIVHSHNNTRTVDRVASFPRRMYTRSMKLLVRWFSTAGLGTSKSAAALMFGDSWSLEPRWRVLPACVDLTAFRGGPDRARVRGELGIPDSAIVFGHVGRFVEQKNHEFLIRVAAILATREPRARFVLIGTGPTQRLVEDMIRECRLEDHITVFAPRDDIPRMMLGAFDFFLFPSLYEGLGLALVEAQAAGLSCFASTAIPPEAIVVPSLVHQLPLAVGPEYWANAILRSIGERRPFTQTEALRQVELAFDIRRNAAQLVEFYQAAL